MFNQESQSTDSLICQILSTAEGVDEHEDAGNRGAGSRWALSGPHLSIYRTRGVPNCDYRSLESGGLSFGLDTSGCL